MTWICGLSVKVVNASFMLQLRANEVYTLTTVADGNKGSYGIPPNSSAFPVPYVETFESNSWCFFFKLFISVDEKLKSEVEKKLYI